MEQQQYSRNSYPSYELQYKTLLEIKILLKCVCHTNRSNQHFSLCKLEGMLMTIPSIYLNQNNYSTNDIRAREEPSIFIRNRMKHHQLLERNNLRWYNGPLDLIYPNHFWTFLLPWGSLLNS